MAMNAVSGNGVGGASGVLSASALDKFQQIRDLAKKKLDGVDNRTKLSDLLIQKKAEFSGVKVPPQKMVSTAADFLSGNKVRTEFKAANGGQGVSSAYGRAGGLEKTDTKPKLGRFVDFTA